MADQPTNMLLWFLATTAVCVLSCTADAFQTTSVSWKQQRACGHRMYFDESEAFGSDKEDYTNNEEKEDPSVSRGTYYVADTSDVPIKFTGAIIYGYWSHKTLVRPTVCWNSGS